MQAKPLPGSSSPMRLYIRRSPGHGRPEPGGVCIRAQLGWWQRCPELALPGSQLVHRVPRSLGPAQVLAQWSRHAPEGSVASSCMVAFVRPGLLEPLLDYLNLSLAGESFTPTQRLCATGCSSVSPASGASPRSSQAVAVPEPGATPVCSAACCSPVEGPFALRARAGF